jgi:2'-phosphotransferase
MRGTCDIYIEIDLEGAMKDGIKFYISSNNVILTEGDNGTLSPKYLKKITRKNGDLL